MLVLRQSLKEIWSQKTRFWLTILAVSWGTLSICSMLAVGAGLRQTFTQAMQNNGGKILIIRAGISTLASPGHNIGTPVTFTPAVIRAIKEAVPNIKHLSGAYDAFGPVLRHGKQQSKWYSPQAVNALDGTLYHIKIAPGGRFINPLDNKYKRRVVVLGEKIAKQLFKPSQPVIGQNIHLDHWLFTVIGVTQNKIQFGQSDNDKIWIPKKTYEMLSHKKNVDYITLVPEQPENNPRLISSLRQVIAKVAQFNPNDTALINTRDLYAQQKMVSIIMLGLQIFLGFIGGITLMVAGIGIANVVFASVKQSTRRIGIQMALGAKRWYILRQYLLESLLVTSIGGTIGIIIIAILIQLYQHFPPHNPFSQFLGNPMPILSTGVLITVIVCLGLVGAIAGWFPARRAANIDPAKALRHE